MPPTDPVSPGSRRVYLGATALAALAVTAWPALAASRLSTQDYLQMPELFQGSVVLGAMAILPRWAAEIGDEAARACYARWTSPEDVVALVSLHARRTPGAQSAEFADTLIAALRERCAAQE